MVFPTNELVKPGLARIYMPKSISIKTLSFPLKSYAAGFISKFPVHFIAARKPQQTKQQNILHWTDTAQSETEEGKKQAKNVIVFLVRLVGLFFSRIMEHCTWFVSDRDMFSSVGPHHSCRLLSTARSCRTKLYKKYKIGCGKGNKLGGVGWRWT